MIQILIQILICIHFFWNFRHFLLPSAPCRTKSPMSQTTLDRASIARGASGALQQLGKSMYRIRKLFQTNSSYVKVMFLFGVLQTIALAFFTRGFLLSRNVLPNLATCDSQFPITNSESCFHPSPFNKAVILIIDALRFDFTIPFENVDETSPEYHYHNNFNVFYDSFVKHPENSLLLKFIADPPTTTLQRLKGLTTGSLPTFIDAGSNFDGDTITEDNLLSQLFYHNKSVAFAGDDTWTALFSPFLNKSITYPYDSLNVWDLHSVDNGVIDHIFPLLERENQSKWDVLIGHFLGVDHCGHRYGPDHFAMKSKLEQLNVVVQDIMNKISDDTLLVVFGDHGMDSTGNHGGESDDEVEAALFMYSKTKHFTRLDPESYDISDGGKRFRSVNQIDITSTLAMLLGIPIPFNNLGSPIAETFMHNKNDYLVAEKITSSQIQNYRMSSNELKDDTEVNGYFNRMDQNLIESHIRYQSLSLRKCKEKWAQFDDLNIWIGIVLLGLSLIVIIAYSKLVPSVVVSQLNHQCFLASIILISVYCVLTASFATVFKPTGLPLNWALLLGCALGIANGILAPIMDRYSVFWLLLQVKENLIQNGWTYTGMFFIFLHSLIFGSNSFIIWEDKIVSFWLTTFGFLAFFKSFQNQEKHKKLIGAYHSMMFMIFTRLASLISICREEQGDKCVSNFKITKWSIAGLYISALLLPIIIKRFYKISYSYEGSAPVWISVGFRTVLLMIAVLGTFEFIENDHYMNQVIELPLDVMKTLRLTISRGVLGVSLVAANFGWNAGPLCIRVELEQHEVETELSKKNKKSSRKMVKTAKIIGYNNVYGSSYFLFFINILCSVLVVCKPLGGISLFFFVNQLLTLLELVDILNIRTNLISSIVLCLLGYQHFFTTGHQATLQSIQWEVGFVFTESIVFPITHFGILLNTLGPFILVCVAVPLLTLWKIPPTNKPVALSSKIAENAMSMIIYQTCLTFVTLITTNNFRRHLMVWKIFAPRFMLNALVLFLMNVVLTFISVGYASYSVVSRWYDVYGGA